VYKLDWMNRLTEHLADHYDPGKPLVLCGDFNVARDDLDAAKPMVWAESVLCVPEVRARLSDWLAWGLRDVLREKHPDGGVYSWWDYRMLAFPKDDGLRLDYILTTPALADSCTSASVDRDERKGDKPSDHAPVVADFTWGK
jgi:exodeoxyribonuclease-3